MKNSDALGAVESAIADTELLIMRVGNVTPCDIGQNDLPGIAAGAYRVVEVTIAVPDKD